ncbi:isochorismatase family protein [Escherichia coli]
MDELVPQPGDIVLPKPRYSGFFNTPLDSILRSRGIRHLVFTGIATKMSASNRRYAMAFFWIFCVVLEDATHQAGAEFAQKAALFNIETFFGWVSDVERSATGLSPHPLLVSLKEFNDAKIRNYSRWQQRTAGPLRSRHAG